MRRLSRRFALWRREEGGGGESGVRRKAKNVGALYALVGGCKRLIIWWFALGWGGGGLGGVGTVYEIVQQLFSARDRRRVDAAGGPLAND